MLRELAVRTAWGRNKNDNPKAATILAVNGNGTYKIRYRGKEYDNIGSISGSSYRVGQTVLVVISFGQIFLE